MKTSFPFPKNKTIVRLTADEGYKLTCYDPETEDVVYFDCFKSVTTKTSRMSKFWEIPDAQADEYARLRDLRLYGDSTSGDDVTGENV